ncbi:cation:proton antiporter [Georgenia halophila]|uniref:Cation:proton antiporter n=1 Tax=Georgenia halophila TaxID=620889 RepID=A0ABP8L8B5_9MICO
MEASAIVYVAAGLTALLAAMLPRVLSRAPVSMPMVLLAAGVVAFALLDHLPDPDPVAHQAIAEHVTEITVIVSLMGAGLALNRPIGWRRWISTWRLLGITMPLTMLAVGLLGGWLLGVGAAAAVLLAACLAPTDPVLASEVQVGEPSDEPDEEDEARFALTSEAGLNDGLAFPFTYMAIAIATAGLAPAGWLGRWLAVDVLWRISAGVAVGLAVGWLLSKLFFRAPSRRLRLAEHGEGFVAIAATFAAYGIAEVIEGYGFIAVFVCAVTIRATERDSGYQRVLHEYVEQIERLLTVVVLVLLGGAVARGLFAELTWQQVVFAVVVIVLVRPLAGWVGLARGDTDLRERGAISYFGVRGIGSLYYMSYALGETAIPEARDLWAVVGLVVVSSVVLHGSTATPVMSFLDRRRRQSLPARDDEAPGPPA